MNPFCQVMTALGRRKQPREEYEYSPRQRMKFFDLITLMNRRSITLKGFLVLISMIFASIMYAADLSVYHHENQDPGKFVILIDNEVFTCYRVGPGQKYPYFFPVNGPVSQISLTTDSGVPYDHHRSLWFGCDKVNGGNYWQEGIETGQIISQGPVVLQNGPELIHIEDTCDWKQPGEESIIRDTRDIIISAPSDSLRFIDISITVLALTDIHIEQTNHSLLSVRMKESLSVSNGGSLKNSAGKKGEKETAGKEAFWCDYTGEHFGILEGITIFNSPNNIWNPVKWFTRDYGFFSPTNMNFLPEGLSIKKNDSLTFEYRIVVHSGELNHDKIDELYQTWTKRPKQK